MLTNPHTGTRIDEVAAGIYRINTPLRIDAIPGGFNLSQYLIVDDEPMIFHTGWRKYLGNSRARRDLVLEPGGV